MARRFNCGILRLGKTVGVVETVKVMQKLKFGVLALLRTST